MVHSHATAFAGKHVKLWNIGDAMLDLESTIPRIAVEYDEGELPDILQALLESHDGTQLTGLVIGAWQEVWEPTSAKADELVQALVSVREQLPNLTALFWADLVSEESEISWIANTDISPLWEVFPKLEYLTIRGGNSLSLGTLNLAHLKKLRIETGGMSQKVVQQVAHAHLAHLEHLELYLGEDNYGANYDIEDLHPIFTGKNLPKLTYLGLKNAALQDDIAEAIVNADIVTQLKTLDISLGILTDRGAEALLQSERIKALPAVIIEHHYCSDEMVKKLTALGNVDIYGQQEADIYDDEVYAYVAIGE